MKGKIFIKKLALILGFFLIILCTCNQKTYAANNPYPINRDEYRQGEWSNCTWSAWKIVYDQLGIELPAWGNAGNWYANAEAQGYAVGIDPQPNSIMCMSNHVGYVEYVSDDGTQVYLWEGGERIGVGIGLHKNWSVAYGTKPYSGTIQGYIYLKPKIPTNVLDFGKSFYSYILMSNDVTLFNVDVNNKVVLQNGINMDKKQIWKFAKQSDGSYTIQNVSTGKYLEVYNSNDYNGGIIQTNKYKGDNSQKFFLTGSQNKCVLKPACSANRVVSVYGNMNTTGCWFYMWEYYGVGSQHFNIWKVNNAKASKLTYSASGRNVTLNWSKGDGADKYNIFIKTGKKGNVKEYKNIIDIAQTSYKITLPKGYYEVTVEGWNYFSHDYSNVVKFNVSNSTKDISKGSLSTKYDRYVYNGKKLTPKAIVKYGKSSLKEGRDFTVSYSNNVNTGKATIIIKGKGIYTGTKKKTFKIIPAKVKKLKVKSQTQNQITLTWSKHSGNITGYRIFKYNSKTKKFVYVGKTKNTNYTVKKLNAGTSYKLKVIAYKTIDKKDYGTNMKAITATTKTKTPSISVTAGSKKATIKWGKISGATGYEVYIATSKNGKFVKTAVANNKTFKYIKNKLKKGKTYYFKVRTYRAVGGKNVYSNFSAVKLAKIK